MIVLNVLLHVASVPGHAGSFKIHKNPFLNDQKIQKSHWIGCILNILILVNNVHGLVMVSFNFCDINYPKVNKLKLIRTVNVIALFIVIHLSSSKNRVTQSAGGRDTSCDLLGPVPSTDSNRRTSYLSTQQIVSRSVPSTDSDRRTRLVPC